MSCGDGSKPVLPAAYRYLLRRNFIWHSFPPFIYLLTEQEGLNQYWTRIVQLLIPFTQGSIIDPEQLILTQTACGTLS